MPLKLIWKVSPPPTGSYSAFSNRPWPMARLNDRDETIVFALSCEDDYVPARVKAGNHGPISIRVADRSSQTISENGTWRWRILKRKAATLEEAKKIASEFFIANPHIFSIEAKNDDPITPCP